MKKTSLVDIAKALNISPTTVSFILNNKAEEKRISKKLVKIVLDYVEEVGYRPNPLARSLRTGKTNTIGLMVEDIANPFFGNIARKIEEEAYKNGYRILYCSTDNDTEKSIDLINMFRERQVDGYIISPPPGVEKEIQSLIKSNIPVVLFDRTLDDLDVDSVLIDNFASTYQATLHLLVSYRNIAFITLNSTQSQMIQRRSGYQKAMEESGLSPQIKEIPFSLANKEIQNQIKSFLKDNPSIDAIIFSTNYLGVNGLKAIHLLNEEKPLQLGIVAFDNHDLFELYSPAITAISQPITEIANTVIKLLMKKLNGVDHSETQQIILDTKLEIRSSSQKRND